MKFAIISDSHNNQPNIIKAIDYLNKNNIKQLIHCGDIDTADDLKLFAEKFKGNIDLVYGNSDYGKDGMEDLVEQHKNLTSHNELGEKEIDGIKIAWNHYPKIAEDLANSQKYDLVFYGHDHKPWEDTMSGTQMLNPGNLAGQRYKATFAIYDTESKKAKLILVETI